MWLMMLENDAVITIPFGFAFLCLGTTLAWLVLQQWSFVAPMRCAAELGICGGIGGLGVYVLILHALVYLATPDFGAVR